MSRDCRKHCGDAVFIVEPWYLSLETCQLVVIAGKFHIQSSRRENIVNDYLPNDAIDETCDRFERAWWIVADFIAEDRFGGDTFAVATGPGAEDVEGHGREADKALFVIFAAVGYERRDGGEGRR